MVSEIFRLQKIINSYLKQSARTNCCLCIKESNNILIRTLKVDSCLFLCWGDWLCVYEAVSKFVFLFILKNVSIFGQFWSILFLSFSLRGANCFVCIHFQTLVEHGQLQSWSQPLLNGTVMNSHGQSCIVMHSDASSC